MKGVLQCMWEEVGSHSQLIAIDFRWIWVGFLYVDMRFFDWFRDVCFFQGLDFLFSVKHDAFRIHADPLEYLISVDLDEIFLSPTSSKPGSIRLDRKSSN